MEPEATAAAVDYHGQPFSHSSTGGWRSAAFIIGMEMAERLAYYGIASNLISYLTGPMGRSTASAAANVNAWSGTAAMLPLLGGIVADAWLGRYRSILVAFGLYLLGLGMLTISAFLPSLGPPTCTTNGTSSTTCHPSPIQTTIFFFAIYVVALAQGCHKPNAQSFAADQFDEDHPIESKSKSSFFNWWYCGTALGAMVAILVVNYIQENVSWGIGFGIPFGAMGIAATLFLLGARTYRYYRVSDIVKGLVMKIYGVMLGLWRRPLRLLRHQPHIKGERDSVLGIEGGVVESEPQQQSRSFNSVSHKEKGIRRLFPIWVTCLMYGIVFAQTTTLFTKQGSTMNHSINSKLKVPPATLQFLTSSTVILGTPIYDCLFVPMARRLTGLPSGITMLQRIGIGQFFALVSMLTAALVEMKRLNIAREHGLVNLSKVEEVPMKLWWLVPQYVLFGIADLFTVVGMQEFFYDQAPDGLRSFGMSLYLGVLGIGSFASSILVTMIDKVSGRNGGSWFANNLNNAHIDRFYLLVACLSGVELILFVYFARCYQYRGKEATIGSK